MGNKPSGRNRSRGRENRGFTLIEVAVATVLVGLGVVALMVASGSATRVNDANHKLTQAVILVQELREWTLRLPFSDPDPEDQGNPPGPDGVDPQVFVDDLDDLMYVTFDPPRDGQGNAIADLPGWSEIITLSWRNPDDVTNVVSAGTSDVIHVYVAIFFNGKEILKTTWLATRGMQQ